jgi:hypothetical protein
MPDKDKKIGNKKIRRWKKKQLIMYDRNLRPCALVEEKLKDQNIKI